MAEPERLAVDGDGVTLAADRWTAAASRGVVVLSHGAGQTRHSWARTARRLAGEGWTTVALDLRGHGDSDWAPDGDYRHGPFVADLESVVRSLGEPVVLVGASLGGIVSLLLAGERPELVRALVLVDVVVTPERKGVERIREFMTAHDHGFATLQEAGDAVAAYNPDRPRPPRPDGLRKNLRRGDDGRWHWHWDPAFMGSRPARLDRGAVRGAAARLEVPVAVIRGGRSDVVSDDGVRELRELIPQVEIDDVSAAGHMIAGDDNDVFARRLQGFLERVDAARDISHG